MVVRNKNVCESFQTQTWYLDVYPCLHDQIKPTTLSFTPILCFMTIAQNHCNGYPRLNCTYLYNCSFTWYDQKPIRKPRLSTLLDPTYAKHYSHSVKRYIGHFKYLHIHNGSKTVAMDTLDYTGHISTTIGSNDMI